MRFILYRLTIYNQVIMKYLTLLLLVLGISASTMAQNMPAEHKFPMSLDSFYLQVKFVDGSKRDYEAYKTRDTISTWLLTDTVLYNMITFDNIETMLMFIMHVKGMKAKSYLIKPMLPADIDDKLIMRPSARPSKE
jgi:hypothetical protein